MGTLALDRDFFELLFMPGNPLSGGLPGFYSAADTDECDGGRRSERDGVGAGGGAAGVDFGGDAGGGEVAGAHGLRRRRRRDRRRRG